MASLELQNITKTFGKKIALDDVSFKCKEGEMFCLLGASGAGKSTCINVISGVVQPDAGKVLLGGEDCSDAFPQARNVATAFENYALYPHMTVRENLLFPLNSPIRKKRSSKAEKEARVREVAEMLGIQELLERHPQELSGGQKQRVALGRTLVRRPNMFLLDEPISHLDAKLRHRMRSELKRIQREFGVTTLYSTPDQLEALSMADTVAVIREGVVQQIGTPDEVYYKPRNIFVAQFLGDPPMNLLPVDYQGDFAVVDCQSPYKLPIPRKDQNLLNEKIGSCQIVIGVRPRDIRFVNPDDPSALTKGTIKIVETLGQTTIVNVQVVSEEIKVKTHTDSVPKVGTQIGMAYDLDNLYYFDRDTSLSI
ncbi:MAG: ABC transporter ATP-binding protein [Chloroflexi bacterium]|nr:ABC transporter ATP-binding protein [Chloroflexota bacterium]